MNNLGKMRGNNEKMSKMKNWAKLIQAQPIYNPKRERKKGKPKNAPKPHVHGTWPLPPFYFSFSLPSHSALDPRKKKPDPPLSSLFSHLHFISTFSSLSLNHTAPYPSSSTTIQHHTPIHHPKLPPQHASTPNNIIPSRPSTALANQGLWLREAQV